MLLISYRASIVYDRLYMPNLHRISFKHKKSGSNKDEEPNQPIDQANTLGHKMSVLTTNTSL